MHSDNIMGLKMGIMQGRLTDKGGFHPQQFPFGDWEKEFGFAGSNNIFGIEWMFNHDQFERNPIIGKDNKRIQELVRKTGVRVVSVCANYYMEKCFFGPKDSSFQIERLLEGMASIDCRLLVIPLFEASAPQNMTEESALKEGLSNLALKAKKIGIKIAIETDWNAERIQGFVDEVKMVGVCYDIGNATGCGYDAAKEIELLSFRILDVHIKDKRRGGSSVMLGEGNADFVACLRSLRNEGYKEWLILESYYGENAVVDTMANRDYILKRAEGL